MSSVIDMLLGPLDPLDAYMADRRATELGLTREEYLLHLIRKDLAMPERLEVVIREVQRQAQLRGMSAEELLNEILEDAAKKPRRKKNDA